MQRGDAGHTHMTISPLFTLTPPWHTQIPHTTIQQGIWLMPPSWHNLLALMCNNAQGCMANGSTEHMAGFFPALFREC